jgi:hypothetical protein
MRAGMSKFYRVFGTLAFIVMVPIYVVRWVSGPPTTAGTPLLTPKLGDLQVTIERWTQDKGEHQIKKFVPMTWRHVSRNSMGDKWPLTVSEAHVGCSKDLPGVSALLVVDDVPWALNGTTKGWARGGRYRLNVGGKPIVVQVSDQPEPWWEIEPELVIGGKTGRKHIGPLFDEVEDIGCLLFAGLNRKKTLPH